MLDQPACRVCTHQFIEIHSFSVPHQIGKSFCAMNQVLQKAAVDWERYTHIAFTSRIGIQAFLDALEAHCGFDQALTKLRNGNSSTTFCALGADAELLHSMGIIDVLTPQEVRVPGTVL